MKPPADEETICAISTPLGNGGIGIIRLSGKKSFEIGDRIFRSNKKNNLQNSPTCQIHYGRIINPFTGEILDEALASVMRAPRSYTAEDVLELSCHGNLRSLRNVLSILIQQGAREALPGEFTKRAFLNGRIDLVQAEAVMDLISAESEAGRRNALNNLNGTFSRIISELREELIILLARIEANIDFSEEEIEVFPADKARQSVSLLINKVEDLLKTARDGRIAREGYLVAIAGKPNVGKSSLLNILLEKDRAIVTPVAGTTRDSLEESVLLQGVRVRLLDTAGIRRTDDLVEKEGIRRTENHLAEADLVLWMVDASIGLTPEDNKEIEKISGKNYLILFNKMDLVHHFSWTENRIIPKGRILRISSLSNYGIKELKERIVYESEKYSGASKIDGAAVVVRGRHEDLLKAAKEALLRASESLKDNMSIEFVALDLKGALNVLGEILGICAPEEVLDRIFKDFCIGK